MHLIKNIKNFILKPPKGNFVASGSELSVCEGVCAGLLLLFMPGWQSKGVKSCWHVYQNKCAKRIFANEIPNWHNLPEREGEGGQRGIEGVNFSHV